MPKPKWANSAMHFGDQKPMWVAVDMGFDAMRICLGAEPENYSYDEVMRWMKLMDPGVATGERGHK